MLLLGGTIMRYINELREGETVIGHYLCKSKQSLKSRAGKTYLSLKLQDKTGMVDAKVWDMTNDIKAFDENDFIKILLKITGISILLEYAVSICKDSGESAIANKIDLGGKVILVSMSIPIISTTINALTQLLP